MTYSDLRLSASKAAIGEKITVSVKLENPSGRDITETVQLYIHDKVGSITRPVKELKGFKQVCVKAGCGMRVELELDSSKLGFYNSELKYVVEPGEFEVMVGPSSDSRSLLSSAFVLE